MKKFKLLTAFITLFMIVGCNKNENGQTNNEQTVDNGDSGLVTPPDEGGNNNNNNNNNGGDTGENGKTETKETLIESLTFTKSEVEIAVNRGYQVEYEIKPFNATNKNLRWASTDYVVAAVSKEGRITALGEGECIITATTMDGTNISKSINVKVYPIDVTDLLLDVRTKEIKIGNSFNIKATIFPTNATYQDVEYVSEDPNVAVVTDRGAVSGVGEGETDIVVTSTKYPDKTAKCHVKVSAVIAERINYRLSDIEMKQGDNYFFTPIIVPTNTSNKGITYSNDNPSVVSVSETGEIYAIAPGFATVTATSKSNTSLSTQLKVTVKDSSALVKTRLSYTYKDFANNNIFNVDNANYKSTHALIVPVWFTDSGNYIRNKEGVREDIEKAYLGSNEDTGWRSVKTFYEEEGRGRYTFTGVVTNWFECSLPSSTFYNTETSYNLDEAIVSSAVNWYKKTYSVNDMKAFDADSNGYIDAVILIYGAPDYDALQNLNATNMWAYTSWLLKTSYRDYDNPGPNAYMWASYDFMYGKGHVNNFRGYESGNTDHCNIDTHTYIHEFGHLLGLNDYYDYSHQYSPSGGFSMQDHNVGSHDPYSLLTYGFIDPYVVNDSTTITISDFQSSGDVVLLSNKENVNSPFDEYILLELYTPTGLNEFDTLYKYGEKTPQGVDEVGIRVWHVDGRLVYGNSSYDLTADHITTNPFIEGYKVWNMMGNTYYSSTLGETKGSPLGKDYMDYNELQLIRNDVEVTYKDENTFNSSFLFKQGDTFSVNKFNKQFVNKYYLNDGSLFSFNVEVTKIEDNKATLTITK